MPERQSDIIKRGRDDSFTATREERAANAVKMFAEIMVFLLPAASYKAPVRILPTPLNTERTPTSVVAIFSGEPTKSARSRAKLITEFPTAARNAIIKKAFQKVRVLSISEGAKSFELSLSFAFPSLGAGREVSKEGFFNIKAERIITAEITIPSSIYVFLHPKEGKVNSLDITSPIRRVLMPNPIIRQPELSPLLSGNQEFTVDTTTLYAIPIPLPAKKA